MFNTLLLKQSLKQEPDECHVLNLSSKQLPTPQQQVLSRGRLNFAPALKCIPRPKAHIVASAEVAITQSKAIEDQTIKAHYRFHWCAHAVMLDASKDHHPARGDESCDGACQGC